MADMHDADGMSEQEEGEIEDTLEETESREKKTEDVNQTMADKKMDEEDSSVVERSTTVATEHETTTSFTSMRDPSTEKSYRSTRVPGLSSSEEDSDDSEDEDVPWKRRCKHKPEKKTERDKPFVNPLLEQKQGSNMSFVQMSQNYANGPKKRVNNIWGSVLQEQTLSQSVLQFGVEKGDELDTVERDVESYNFSKALHDNRPDLSEGEEMVEEEDAADPFENVLHQEYGIVEFGEKKKSVKDRLGAKVDDSDDLRTNRKRGHSKISKEPPLPKEPLCRTVDVERFEKFSSVTEDDPIEKVVNVLVEVLDEPKVELMNRVVDILGAKKSLALLRMTADVEEAGGMLVNNGTRYRTPGGVYIQLLKSDPHVTPEQLKEIFMDEKKEQYLKQKKRFQERRRKERRRAQAALAEKVKMEASLTHPEQGPTAESQAEGQPSGEPHTDQVQQTESPDLTETQTVMQRSGSDMEEGEIE